MDIKALCEEIIRKESYLINEELNEQDKIKKILLSNNLQFSQGIFLYQNGVYKKIIKKIDKTAYYDNAHDADNFSELNTDIESPQKYYFLTTYYYFTNESTKESKAGLDLYEFEITVTANNIDKITPTFYSTDLKLIKKYHTEFDNQESLKDFFKKYAYKYRPMKKHEKRVERALK